MAERSLIITVRMLDGRYHGVGDWPPSPFRLFQALVSAAHAGCAPSRAEIEALACLEHLGPPVIAAPKAKKSRTVTYYVPNNDLDTVGGDPARIASIRTGKPVGAWLFDRQASFLYVWLLSGSENRTSAILSVSERLYQFGRGVDMAYAVAEILNLEEAERRLDEHGGTIYRSTPRGSGPALRCPTSGSLNSLTKRHEGQLKRLAGNALQQAPPAVFTPIPYDSPPTRLLFDLVSNDPKEGSNAQRLERIAELTGQVRDLVAKRLESHIGREVVECTIIGRNAGEAEKAHRIRIIPLPSIGFFHADRQVRRLLVEIPSACPVHAKDVAWAFSGLDLGVDAQTGEVLDDSGPHLIRTEERQMLFHYGIGIDESSRAQVWRTVTPVALPFSRLRGRVSGRDRAVHEAGLTHAVHQTLRHAGLDQKVVEVRRIQREPFDTKGIRAEAFAHGKRFATDRLYHLEIDFGEPVPGPIIIGDGRYLGLGLMAPVPEAPCDIVILPLQPANRPVVTKREMFLQAARRALMARARDLNGTPGRLFSGHEPDGAPARSGRHDHVFLAADDVDSDGRIDRLLIIAPWRADHRKPSTREERIFFQKVATCLRTVCTGRLGVVKLGFPEKLSAEDSLFHWSKRWSSVTPYVPTRFPKQIQDACSIVAEDLALECTRRGLPRPEVEIDHIEIGPRGSVCAEIHLTFAVAVQGPLMLGRDCHKGGGVFCAADHPSRMV